MSFVKTWRYRKDGSGVLCETQEDFDRCISEGMKDTPDPKAWDEEDDQCENGVGDNVLNDGTIDRTCSITPESIRQQENKQHEDLQPTQSNDVDTDGNTPGCRIDKPIYNGVEGIDNRKHKRGRPRNKPAVDNYREPIN